MGHCPPGPAGADTFTAARAPASYHRRTDLMRSRRGAGEDRVITEPTPSQATVPSGVQSPEKWLTPGIRTGAASTAAGSSAVVQTAGLGCAG